MIKLIGSDMDGTLLDSNKCVDKEFYKVLEKLNSNNILFAAVSGREIQSLTNIFKEEIIDNIILAPNNGNLVVYKGEVLYENYIDNKKLKSISNIIRKYANHNTIFCGKEKTYSESLKVKIACKAWNTDVEVVEDITKIKDSIMKVSVFADENIIKDVLTNIKDFKKDLSISMSGSNSLDICESNGNKKQAIKVLQEKFDISYEETMVFGDHMNDLEMMESAYYSFAMGNAEDKIKEKARFVTKTNDENGVIEAIKELAIGKEALA